MPPGVKIAVVYGTRPEAVKLSPLIPLLPDPVVIHTGQHQDLAEGILQPTIRLNLPSPNDPEAYAEQAINVLYPRLAGFDLVVVQGDTASAYAGAIAGKQRGIPVAHVEAGLRTGDFSDPWPEERFRVAIDRVSTYLFCPTETALHHLCREPGVKTRQVLVTGNTGIDALYARTSPLKAPYVTQPRVLVTLHRRESFGEPLQHILEGVLRSAKAFPGIEFVWPVHPNPEVQNAASECFTRNLHKTPPLHPDSFTNLLSSSRVVLTDSGGVQEEAAALGIPAVIARNVTDRPESVENFHALLAGTTAQGISSALHKALTYQLSHDPSDCFGDGHSSPRIAQVLLNHHVTT